MHFQSAHQLGQREWKYTPSERNNSKDLTSDSLPRSSYFSLAKAKPYYARLKTWIPISTDLLYRLLLAASHCYIGVGEGM